jgi:hypothetical protein
LFNFEALLGICNSRMSGKNVEKKFATLFQSRSINVFFV